MCLIEISDMFVLKLLFFEYRVNFILCKLPTSTFNINEIICALNLNFQLAFNYDIDMLQAIG